MSEPSGLPPIDLDVWLADVKKAEGLDKPPKQQQQQQQTVRKRSEKITKASQRPITFLRTRQSTQLTYTQVVVQTGSKTFQNRCFFPPIKLDDAFSLKDELDTDQSNEEDQQKMLALFQEAQKKGSPLKPCTSSDQSASLDSTMNKDDDSQKEQKMKKSVSFHNETHNITDKKTS